MKKDVKEFVLEKPGDLPEGYPHQLTNCVKKRKQLRSFIEPFRTYCELDEVVIGSSEEGYALYTKGKHLVVTA